MVLVYTKYGYELIIIYDDNYENYKFVDIFIP